ncbi:hypothetical protein MHK_002180 [Candidatus Magnetomorum sp. HK-1]|nr:hypothetical protein MHK_002180 [Candidatus Magnetomorum sp. HK-1]
MIKEKNFCLSEDKFCEMVDYLKDFHSHNLDLNELENYLNPNGRELIRRLLIGHLNSRGLGDVGPIVIGSDGLHRSHKRTRSRIIKTLFGDIEIKRIGYSNRNVHSLFPLDAMLNLPTLNISYALQKNLILEIIKSSYDDSIASIERWTGVKIKKKQAKQIVIDASKDFDEFYEYKQSTEKEEAVDLPLIVLTSDAKGIVMRKDGLREETKKRAEAKIKKNIKTEPKKTGKEKTDCKRMATVASVYEIDRFIRIPEDISNEFFNKCDSKTKKNRPRPIAKRVWASIEKKSENTLQKMFEEALQRKNSDNKEWVVLVDGDLNQIRAIKNISRKFNKNVVIICDIIHVLEYIWKAGKVLNEKEEVSHWVSKRFELILRGQCKTVASGMKRSATFRKLSKETREPIDKCAKYLHNHSEYLFYNEYLKLGYPIATGIIEGACRYLVKDRMGLTGARWGLEGAEAVLKLRSIKISGDFDLYWDFYEKKQYDRNYKVLYQDPSILKASS